MEIRGRPAENLRRQAEELDSQVKTIRRRLKRNCRGSAKTFGRLDIAEVVKERFFGGKIIKGGSQTSSIVERDDSEDRRSPAHFRVDHAHMQLPCLPQMVQKRQR